MSLFIMPDKALVAPKWFSLFYWAYSLLFQVYYLLMLYHNDMLYISTGLIINW